MISRRALLQAGGAVATGLWAGVGAAAEAEKDDRRAQGTAPETDRLRTISYNVLACSGYRDRKDERSSPRPDIPRSQMTARFALELALYKPDIITFQESPNAETIADIARRMGFKHTCFFPSGQAWPGSLMTRFPILKHENCPLVSFDKRPDKLFTRHWGRAVLETNEDPLAIYSAHLFPGGGSVTRREPEVTEMLKVMREDLDSGRSMLFQGDLNHKPDGPEYTRWVEAGLVDCYASRGKGPPETIPSTRPAARIDYIWAHGPLTERLSECRVLFEGAFRTNPDDPGSIALSDHLPVMATFARKKD